MRGCVSGKRHSLQDICEGILNFFDTRIAPLLRNSRNSTHIRNPLIFQGKSLLPHVWAAQQVRTLILQAGTCSDLLSLVCKL